MKRVFDLIMACLALIILSPLFLIILFLVYIDHGYPFFKQKRVGLNEKKFMLYKFRTMKDRDEEKGLISNKDRITKLGRSLRNFSLDELPSLINIIKGDMSFVGPRPLLAEYLPIYKEKHRMRHKVKPGLTGLAQIRGRNQTSWEKRLNNDVYYVHNKSFWFDLKILFSTFVKIIKKEGVENTTDLSIIRLDQDENYLNQK